MRHAFSCKHAEPLPGLGDGLRIAGEQQVGLVQGNGVQQEAPELIRSLGAHDHAQVAEDGLSPFWDAAVALHAVLLLQLPATAMPKSSPWKLRPCTLLSVACLGLPFWLSAYRGCRRILDPCTVTQPGIQVLGTHHRLRIEYRLNDILTKAEAGHGQV